MNSKYSFQLILNSIDKKSIFNYRNFLVKKLKIKNINFTQFFLPQRKKRITLLKSPHVYKSAREQFQLNKYKCIFSIKNLVLSNESILELLLNKPQIISVKIKQGE